MRARVWAVPLLAAPLLLGACTSTPDAAPSSSGAAPSSSVTVQDTSAWQDYVDGATVIDVRTPEEFADMHVDGAVNMDVESGEFAEQVSALDPQGSYVVYCRSGNRSAAAADMMAQQGLTVVDAGGLSQVQALGAPMV